MTLLILATAWGLSFRSMKMTFALRDRDVPRAYTLVKEIVEHIESLGEFGGAILTGTENSPRRYVRTMPRASRTTSPAIMRQPARCAAVAWRHLPSFVRAWPHPGRSR